MVNQDVSCPTSEPAGRRGALWFVCVCFALVLAACAADRTEEPEPTSTIPATTTVPTGWSPESTPCVGNGFAEDCTIPGYPDRSFDIDVPSSYKPGTPMPVLVVLHGGGGNAESARQRACAGGDSSSPSCFHSVGESVGFITVYPNGTGGRFAPEVRTWNAGGGGPDHACVSGRACERGIDDIGYVSSLVDELERQYRIDAGSIYVTGFSNGAAMAHRLACEMSGRIAAIAAVSGANQYATTADCDPSSPVSVLHVHGTDDPCWTYEESSDACLEQDSRPKVSVEESTTGWVDRLGCERAPERSTMPDVSDDGMETTVESWTGCDDGSEVRLMTVTGGGHGYPGGSPGIERIAGSPTRDWDFNEIWAFLSRFGD